MLGPPLTRLLLSGGRTVGPPPLPWPHSFFCWSLASRPYFGTLPPGPGPPPLARSSDIASGRLTSGTGSRGLVPRSVVENCSSTPLTPALPTPVLLLAGRSPAASGSGERADCPSTAALWRNAADATFLLDAGPPPFPTPEQWLAGRTGCPYSMLPPKGLLPTCSLWVQTVALLVP